MIKCDPTAITVALTLVLLFMALKMRKKEHFGDNTGHVKLYESYNYTSGYGRKWEFIGPGYMKKILRVSLKSLDIYVPPTGKRVELWSINENDINASSESPGVVYNLPEHELRANVKFNLIARVGPGQSLKKEITTNINRVLVIAEL